MDTLLAAERALARADGTSFDGWMIGKAEFYLKTAYRADDEEIPAVRFLKRSSFMACMEAESEALSLTMWILKPRGAGEERSCGEEPDAGRTPVCGFSITRQDIDRYQALSGDNNPIHRGIHAIVPGFLLCNRVIPLMLERTRPPFRLKVRFHAPVYEGEFLQCYQNADGSWSMEANGIRAVSMIQKTEEY